MSRTVDYYFAPQSPWAYLGHERLAAIAKAAGATLRVLPVDLGGKVFPISGGLPLPKSTYSWICRRSPRLPLLPGPALPR